MQNRPGLTSVSFVLQIYWSKSYFQNTLNSLNSQILAPPLFSMLISNFQSRKLICKSFQKAGEIHTCILQDIGLALTSPYHQNTSSRATGTVDYVWSLDDLLHGRELSATYWCISGPTFKRTIGQIVRLTLLYLCGDRSKFVCCDSTSCHSTSVEVITVVESLFNLR